MLVTLNLLLAYMADRQTSKTNYINDKFSKMKHFAYQNPWEKDIVFIGSSRTFYHISTNLFKEHNIDVYNFGVSGSKLPDYPTVIHETLQQKPKQVIMSLRVDKLYEALSVSQYPSYQELKYYASIDTSLFLNATLQYFINFHTLLQYSEPIYHQIEALYKKFDFSSTLMNQNVHQGEKLVLQDKSYYSELVGCKVFDVKQTSDKHITLKCTNGDGVIIGSDMRETEEEQNHQLTQLNRNSLDYLTKMIEHLHTEGIKVTLILEPILENQFSYSLQNLSEALPTINIVDLTNYALSYEKWADRRHLNHEGRKQYSEHLIQLYRKNLL